MEPISALLLIVSAHGVNALVRTLSGSSDLGDLSSELFKALRDSESRIDARLGKIEGLLDQLLDQRYAVALGVGLTRFLDAADAVSTPDRAADLEHARTAFIEASAAAQSPLQRAIAERYLVLVALAQGRSDLAVSYLKATESGSTAAAFDAAALTEMNRNQYEMLLRNGRIAPGSEVMPKAEAVTAARDSLAMSARLLGEMSALAPELGLPPRLAPPNDADYGPSRRAQYANDPPLVRTATHLFSRFDKQEPIDPVDLSLASDITRPYWTFDIAAEHTVRVGSMSLSVRQITGGNQSAHHAHLELDRPLPHPIVMHWLHERGHRSGGPDLFREPRAGVRPWTPGSSGPFTSMRPPPPPRIRLPMGWASARPPNGIEVASGSLAVDLSSRPLPSGWGNQDLDPSRLAIRLNPSYTSNHFIIVRLAV